MERVNKIEFNDKLVVKNIPKDILAAIPDIHGILFKSDCFGNKYSELCDFFVTPTIMIDSLYHYFHNHYSFIHSLI